MTAAIAEPRLDASAPPSTTARSSDGAGTRAVCLVDDDYDAGKERSERVAAAAQRRAAARTRDLTALLRERPDLAGVHAPADCAVEAVRGCA